MGEVLKLGITANNNQSINEVNSIEVLANKGIVGDRHFHDFNDPYNQLSLIESENIDEYNIKFGLDIPHINFRRNVVTKGIKLNEHYIFPTYLFHLAFFFQLIIFLLLPLMLHY